MTEIKILFGALEDSPSRGGLPILRGVLGIEDLRHIKFGDYQRELLPASTRASIFAALQSGEALPDVELGMRGQKFRTRGDDYFLQDDVYGIDGLQRIRSAMDYYALHPQTEIQLGCCVHFATNEAWERDRFQLLNAHRTKVSPNVLLRNLRDQYRPVLMLYGLTTNQTGFVLHNRVCWMQNKQRSHLLGALVCLKLVSTLHSHLSPGQFSNSLQAVLSSLVKLETVIGIQHMRDNVGAFWNLIDECFGVRKIEHSVCAPHLRGTFLAVLSRVLADHSNFWRANKKQLFIEADVRRKISQFDLQNEDIRRLCGSAGASVEILYELLLRHINSGKRTGRLTRWSVDDDKPPRKPRGKPAADDATEHSRPV
jgi:hypothetical protein